MPQHHEDILDAPAAGSTTTVLTTSGMLEQLHDELQLELAPPRKLLRQFSLNVPPSSASLGADGASPSGFRSAVLARKLLSHTSPTALGGVLERWERNQLKWRRHSSSFELGSSGGQSPASEQLPPPQQQQPDDNDADERRLDDVSVSPLNDDNSNNNSTTTTRPIAMGGIPYVRHETLEVVFGPGFLGLELTVDEARNEVVVTRVHPAAPATRMPHSPPLAKLTRGLFVDAVNGQDVSGGRLPPTETLELLQVTARPMRVRFRKVRDAIVVCKLCECTVDATDLDAHTNYCVMSTRLELEADQINGALTKLAHSIDANLHADVLRKLFHPEDLHFYNALRVVAIQVRGCRLNPVV